MSRLKPVKARAAAPALAMGPPELTCYRMWPTSPELTPAKSERSWMDMTSDRFAYRCIPLSIANASGWEIALPFGFEAVWYGGDEVGAVQLRSGDNRLAHSVTSHFGHGTITFHTGWLFRTSPGWAVWTRGTPNSVKDGIIALDGLVETDWLPFPFTMNWRFTRPGVIKFEPNEPFCFITLAPHGPTRRGAPAAPISTSDWRRAKPAPSPRSGNAPMCRAAAASRTAPRTITSPSDG